MNVLQFLIRGHTALLISDLIRMRMRGIIRRKGYLCQMCQRASAEVRTLLRIFSPKVLN